MFQDHFKGVPTARFSRLRTFACSCLFGVAASAASAQLAAIPTIDGAAPAVIGMGAPVYRLGAGMAADVARTPAESAKMLSDAGASCETLKAEVMQLEQALGHKQRQLRASERAFEEAKAAMMQSGLGGAADAVSSATGLLSMIPGVGFGVGIAGSIASTVAANARSASLQEQSTRMEKAYMDIQELGSDVSRDQARRDHVVDLFLSRDCKLPNQPFTAAASSEDTSAQAGPPGNR